MPYAAIHFSVYEHYRRLIKSQLLPENGGQQPQQPPVPDSAEGEAKIGVREGEEAAAAVARALHSQQQARIMEDGNAAVAQATSGTPSQSQQRARTAEEKNAAVAAAVDQVMEESSASGSSVDFTAAVVAAEAQVCETHLWISRLICSKLCCCRGEKDYLPQNRYRMATTDTMQPNWAMPALCTIM
jgi:hypothetical protein